jgi:hypothetical protein
VAIPEAEKLKLLNNHLYYSLLGYLYAGIENDKALGHLNTALKLAKSAPDKAAIERNITKLNFASTETYEVSKTS